VEGGLLCRLLQVTRLVFFSQTAAVSCSVSDPFFRLVEGLGPILLPGLAVSCSVSDPFFRLVEGLGPILLPGLAVSCSVSDPFFSLFCLDATGLHSPSGGVPRAGIRYENRHHSLGRNRHYKNTVSAHAEGPGNFWLSGAGPFQGGHRCASSRQE
jgi:hypothetical protein